MKISVIISTHNRPELLEKAIISLANQSISMESYEILIGDSNSTIKAKYIVDKIKILFPLLNIRYIYNAQNGGWTSTRHKLISMAKYEVCVIGDDDFEAESDYLEGVLDIFQSFTDIGIVEGRMLPKYNQNPPDFVDDLWTLTDYGKILTDYTLLDFGTEIQEITANYAFGSNFAFKKSVFNMSNGFGPDGFGGGYLYLNGNGEHHFSKYVKEKGFKIYYQPKMLAYHNIEPYRFTKEYFCARHFYYGINDSFNKIRRDNGVIKNNIIFKATFKLMLYKFISKFIKDVKITFKLNLRMEHLKGFLFQYRLAKNNKELIDYIMLNNWMDTDFNKYDSIDTKSKSLW
ncbi:glycosyltransferase [Aliarcobacter cryaerophilus]|uniref:glycosyltransferase family 2 protein n=1 Tax=Aliarcobacter cryaerophilus TaxID=28198 RepID=UPI003DA59447